MPPSLEKRQEYAATYRSRHRVAINARSRERRQKDLGKFLAAEKQARVANPGRAQSHGWKGIVNEDGTPFMPVNYDRAYQIQGGRCLICRRHSTEFKKRLSADHDHKTGQFRALLCNPCNLKIGHYESFETQGKIYLSGGK